MFFKLPKRKKSGFVLVIATLVISLGVLITSLVVNRVNAYRHMSRLRVDTEKARMIALSGIDVAISQLGVFAPQKKSDEQKPSPDKKPESPQEKKEDNKDDNDKEKAEFLVKKLNRWQKFELDESADGLNGELKIYIGSENGKINLNKLYDFEKNKFMSQIPAEQPGGAPTQFDEKKFFQFLQEKIGLAFKLSKNIDFGSLLESFFKKRGEPLEDVSDLLAIPELAPLANMLFISPERETALGDLFTVSTQTQPTPLLFSQTAQTIMELKNPTKGNTEKLPIDGIAQIIRSQKINWQSVWTPTLSVLYAKEYAAIPPQIKLLFEARFEPTVFSVVSYGKVGLATQKICAIIEKNSSDNKRQPFLITKFYWL